MNKELTLISLIKDFVNSEFPNIIVKETKYCGVVYSIQLFKSSNFLAMFWNPKFDYVGFVIYHRFRSNHYSYHNDFDPCNPEFFNNLRLLIKESSLLI